MNTSKVYCEKCKYISSTGWFCHKEKRPPTIEDNYLHKKATQYWVSAETKNFNNDCKDFKNKLWLF